MNSDAEFAEHVVELLSGFGDSSAKRMFGGYGIFREGLMFALIGDGELFLKVDDDNRAEFEARQLGPFTYQKDDKAAHLSYYACPEEAFRNPAAMARWAELGWGAAVRADEAKAPSKRKRT